MTTINLSTMTDTELQNLIEQAGKEQDNRMRAKRKAAERRFWEAANDLNAICSSYELFDDIGYVITIGDIILEHKERDGG